jgi:uncharacterized membrane protein
MATVYNKIAGQSLERLAALSDGVFAIAMTLLVLDLHAPAAEALRTDADIGRALLGLLPNLVAYVMSFMTLGIFWVGQQTQLSLFARSDRTLTWLYLGFLLLVTLMPFSTAVLAEFITHRIAVALYWLNIALLGAALFASLRYGVRAGLVQPGTPSERTAAQERRIVVAQALYAIGALLCVVNTWTAIGFIFLVQLNYVVAPRIRPLYRL